MNRLEKKKRVESLSTVFNEATFVVILHNNGLNVPAMNKLRNNLRKVDGKCKMIKNSLVKLSLKNSKYESTMKDSFSGPTMITYCNSDPVSVAKTLVSFAKENKELEVISAGLILKEIVDKLDLNAIRDLSAIPPMNILKAQFVGLLEMPMSMTLNVLKLAAEKNIAAEEEKNII